jgi:cell division protein FtsZ
MMFADNPSKISRRSVFQSLLATLAPVCPVSASRATTSIHPSQTMLRPLDGESRGKFEGARITARPVKLIGVGGAGGSTVDYVIGRGLRGVEFICFNTDAQALARSAATTTIQLGLSGLPSGSQPDTGRAAASAATATIRAAVEGANLLFITAGMGGGTGTGAAPMIARIARDMGIPSVGLVTMPFEWEGDQRLRNAEAGLIELQANVDSMIVLHNDRVLSALGYDVTQDEAFGYVADHFRSVVFGLAEAINSPCAVGTNFIDALKVMRLPGKTMMGCASARGPERARIASEQALACPLSDGSELLLAKGALVLIAATKGCLKSSEFRVVSNFIRTRIAPDAHLVCGVTYDETLRDKIRVTVVSSGLARSSVPPSGVCASHCGSS